MPFNTYVLVKNLGTQPLLWYHNSEPWVIPVGGIAPVDYDAMVNYCGHPDAGVEAKRSTQRTRQGNEVVYVPSRMDERKRLRQKYGLHNLGGEFAMVEGTDPETGQYMTFPHVEVYATEVSLDGQSQQRRLWTVLEDPEGEHQNGISPSQAYLTQAQSARDQEMAFLRAQLNMYEERDRKQQAGLERQDEFVPVPEGAIPQDETPAQVVGGPPSQADLAQAWKLPVRPLGE